MFGGSSEGLDGHALGFEVAGDSCARVQGSVL